MSDVRPLQPSVAQQLQPPLRRSVTQHFKIAPPTAPGGLELTVARFGSEVISLDVVDTSRWERITDLTVRGQSMVSSIVKVLEKPENLPRVNLARLHDALTAIYAHGKVENRFERSVQTLVVGARTDYEIPPVIQADIFHALQLRAPLSDSLRGILSLPHCFPEIISLLLTKNHRSTIHELIHSIGTTAPRYLGGVPIVPLSFGKELARAMFQAGRYHATVDREGLLNLGSRIESFSLEGAVELRRSIGRSLIHHAEWALYCDFAHTLPVNVRPTYEEVSQSLSNIPKHRTERRSMLILTHADLFPARQHDEIIREMIDEGTKTDFRHIPEAVWRGANQGAVAEQLTKRFGSDVVRDNLSRFTALPAVVAETWWRSGQRELVWNHLRSFHDLPASLALEVAAGDRRLWQGPERALANASAFAWKSGDFARFIESMGRRATEAVLENIDVIPNRLLAEIEESYHFAEYQRELGICSVSIYDQFCRLRQGDDRVALDGFVSSIKALAGRIVSSEPHTTALWEHVHYGELVQALYPAHGADNHGLLEVPVAFQITPSRTSLSTINVDRSSDIARFKFDQRYLIDLTESIQMELRDGASLNATRMNVLQEPLSEARDALAQGLLAGKSSEAILEELVYGPHAATGTRRAEIEWKIASRVLNVLQGKEAHDGALTDLIRYHVTTTAHVEDYHRGTRDQASRARNRDYAYLLLLREFFSDQLNDTATRITANIMKSSAHLAKLPDYHAEISARRSEAARKQKLAKLDLEKLGFTPGLARALEEVLLNANLPHERKVRAVASIIAREQQRIASAMSTLSGDSVDPQSIHVGSFSVQSLAEYMTSDPVLSLRPERYEEFLRQRFTDFLAIATQEIDREIVKFRAPNESAGRAVRLEAFFTKNHASVYARRVGGVCVASDWNRYARPHDTDSRDAYPRLTYRGRDIRMTQWDLPNYFQLVFRSTSSFRCEGLVLLHLYEEQGKKILVGSFNPSSTFLFKVDERGLFHGLLEVLRKFALANDIHAIGCSIDPHIRTNRTGGMFELAMNEQIKAVGKQFSLALAAPFSFSPAYSQRVFDLLWVAG